jgi:hypothetical protein
MFAAGSDCWSVLIFFGSDTVEQVLPLLFLRALLGFEHRPTGSHAAMLNLLYSLSTILLRRRSSPRQGGAVSFLSYFDWGVRRAIFNPHDEPGSPAHAFIKVSETISGDLP